VAAVGGEDTDRIRDEYGSFDPVASRERAGAAGLELLCACQATYPAALRALAAPPAVLHVAGGIERFVALCEHDPVAIVGSRRASEYGLGMARGLGRGLASAGVSVVSGMAMGIDASAHRGALDAGGATVAVLPGSAHEAYPRSKRSLHRAIVADGVAVSELGPGAAVWRWCFPARNRLIAALSAMTVVVEAGVRSGALLTAGLARGLGRPLGAVPGRVGSPQAEGPNELLSAGACVVRGPQDVVDRLFGDGRVTVPPDLRPALDGELGTLFDAIASGEDTPHALARAGVPPERGLAALTSLELAGYVRRGAGGRYVVVPPSWA
jgi:DNA processing protein